MQSRPLVAAAPLGSFGRAAALRSPTPRFSLVVDLGADLFSRRWWRGAATLFGMSAGLSLLTPPVALPVGPLPALSAEQSVQEEALRIAPLQAGSGTGLQMSEGPRARPIASAPERTVLALTLIMAPGDDLASLLRRNGASAGDAGRALILAGAAGALPKAGTSIQIRLGAPQSSGRPVDRIAYRARLDLDLAIVRGADGSLTAEKTSLAIDRTPLRIRGSAGSGLYWALRAAGASPELAATYLQTIGGSLDVGSEVGSNDRFELVVAQARSGNGEAVSGPLLYAGLDRVGVRDLSLVRFPVGGRWQWVDAEASPEPVRSGLARPVDGPITSTFGRRVHPILRFARMHNGVDFGAGWGAPIVAAADGVVARAGWAGGYGRQVRIAHGGGLVTSYSHMSRIIAPEGASVRRGELIGYVGSSGLSTGPHLHYEVLKDGTPVNPLAVTLVSRPVLNEGIMAAVRARAKALRGL